MELNSVNRVESGAVQWGKVKLVPVRALLISSLTGSAKAASGERVNAINTVKKCS